MGAGINVNISQLMVFSLDTCKIEHNNLWLD